MPNSISFISLSLSLSLSLTLTASFATPLSLDSPLRAFAIFSLDLSIFQNPIKALYFSDQKFE